MKKVCVIGHFGFGKNLLNGQTVKTKIVTNELNKVLGEENVMKIDTHGGLLALFKLPFQAFRAMRKCENIVILPAHNGLRILTPLLSFYKKFFKRKIHYLVIGGWLVKYIQKKKRLEKKLKKFNGIYVETNTMKSNLEKLGFDNVIVLPNCKELIPLPEEELRSEYTEPYRLCTFSRVMEEKGIEDAVNVIREINNEYGRTVLSLDIYGQVDANQIEWFDELQKKFPDYIKYGGAVPFDKSVETLKDYFALLFPTKFYTEGIPGTIIDAYAAGVPVISAKWESYDDVIDDGVTGLGYEFDNLDELKRTLKETVLAPQRIIDLKSNCIRKANEFLPKEVVGKLVEKF